MREIPAQFQRLVGRDLMNHKNQEIQNGTTVSEKRKMPTMWHRNTLCIQKKDHF
jgi:hypothetical protein